MGALALNGGRPVRRELLPLHRPWFGADEMEAARACLSEGTVGGDGPRGRALEKQLEKSLGARRALLTTSCSSALEMALLVGGLHAGDEVIMPSFNFPSAANAVLRVGARPTFVDVDRRTGNLDPARVREAVTPRTRAIVPVHYGGMACPMEALDAIAAEHRLLVIEDAAHALDATYRGRPLGSWGALGCLSFHESKDVVCGEG